MSRSKRIGQPGPRGAIRATGFREGSGAAYRNSSGAPAFRRSVATSGLAFLLVAIAALGSCASDWVPAGSARVLNWHDEEIGGVPSCVVYLEVTNVGSVRIERSVLSLRIYTASRSYYRTLVLQTPLPPGGLLFAEVSAAYADPGESAEIGGGVELVSCFFE